MFCQSQNVLQVNYYGDNLLAWSGWVLECIKDLGTEIFIFCLFHSLKNLL